MNSEVKADLDTELNVYAGRPMDRYLRYRSARRATSGSWCRKRRIASALNQMAKIG